MKAAAFCTFGGPAVLQVVEVDTPQAGPGEVRVRVEVAGIQPYDSAVRSGWIPPGRSLRFPQTVGNDFAGVVDQVGPGVTDVDAGDEVIGWAVLASCAESVVVPPSQVIAKPPAMSWLQAGTLSASAQTAHTALESLGVGADDTLLIHGAAGGVGTIAVQLAVAYGATVIGTASASNQSYLRSIGAIATTYGKGLAARIRDVAPRGVDATLDAAGGEALDVSLDLVANRRRVGALVDLARAQEFGALTIGTRRSAERLQAIVDVYLESKLKLTVSEVFPLQHIGEAHRRVDTGHSRGKLAIQIRELMSSSCGAPTRNGRRPLSYRSPISRTPRNPFYAVSRIEPVAVQDSRSGRCDAGGLAL